MSDMKIVGMQALKKKLKKNVRMGAVKKVIRHNGSQLQDKAQRNADFKGHYEWVKGKGKVFKKPTGATKEGIRLDLMDNCLTAEVGPITEYAPYLEYGTRFMDAQPFLKPAFDDQKKQFERDMKKLTE